MTIYDMLYLTCILFDLDLSELYFVIALIADFLQCRENASSAKQ